MRPLVIRANAGDTVQMNFENKLSHRASIHVQGIYYNVLISDGANVGLNPDSAADSRICCTRMKGGFKILRGCPDFGETCGRGER